MDTTELQNQAIEIRDAENEGENTATKVGTLLVNIIQALGETVTEERLTETLEVVEEALQRDYASLENNTVKWHQRGVIFLKSMGSALDNIDGGSYTPTLEIGDTWFSPTSGGLVHKTQNGNEAWFVRPDAVYINSHTLRVYKWASGSMVELGSERNPVMIDYMVSKTLDSIAVGEVFWQSSNNKLVIKTGESSVRMFSPDPSVIYCARDTKSLMFWDTTTSTWQSVGGGNAGQITNINDGQNYRIWVGTQEDLDALNGVFEDDVIYLVGTVPQEVTRYSVNTNGLTHCTVPAGTPTKVTENGSFSVVVSPESGYTIDSCYATMGSSTINGVPLTGANAGKHQITINAVTANIVIKASASVHLQSITVTQGTRAGNAIQMNAALNPANADNVSLQWSISEDGANFSSTTSHFEISGSGNTATLVVKDGADNTGVWIKCADTNSASGTANSNVLQLSLSYDDTVPLESLGAVSYTVGAAANTYQFSVAKNPVGANTHSIKWGIDSVSPRGAATIDADTGLLTITNDCEVVVSAKAYQGMAQDTNINTATSGSVQLTFDASNSPIVFEDPTMEAFMLGKVPHANANYITRAEAASYTNTIFNTKATDDLYPFEGIKGSVTKFNEWQYFTGLTSINFENFSVLTEVTMPSTVLLNNDNYKYFNGTLIKRLVIPEGVTSVVLSCLSNDELEEIVFPSTLTSIDANANIKSTLTAKVKVFDLSNTQLTTCSWYRPKLGSVEILKFPSTLQSIGTSSSRVQLLRNNPNLKYVEFGTANGGSVLNTLSVDTYGSTSAPSVIIRATNTPSYNWGNNSADKYYVPDDLLDTYKAATGWSGVKSKIVGISTLPIGWDTPSSDNSGNTQEGGQS